eukprot:COSAG05_NODE_7084_length_857_cov_2.055409_1_plen_41_part_10
MCEYRSVFDLLYVAAKPRRVGQNLCRKQLASTFLDPKIAKE